MNSTGMTFQVGRKEENPGCEVRLVQRVGHLAKLYLRLPQYQVRLACVFSKIKAMGDEVGDTGKMRDC